MNGTRWTAPGRGATVHALLRKVIDRVFTCPGTTGAIDALNAMIRDIGPAHTTNLALTGDDLTDEDIHRATVCE